MIPIITYLQRDNRIKENFDFDWKFKLEAPNLNKPEPNRFKKLVKIFPSITHINKELQKASENIMPKKTSI